MKQKTSANKNTNAFFGSGLAEDSHRQLMRKKSVCACRIKACTFFRRFTGCVAITHLASAPIDGRPLERRERV
jgi:hypothetical protein